MDQIVTDFPALLAESSRACVVAAAGCGKTELIVRAVEKSEGRQLILTHTNAGVEALRRRLRRRGVSSDNAYIDTIDGWCMKYVAAYPQHSGGVTVTESGQPDYDALRESMTRLVTWSTAQTVLQASYEGVFVDEYQDCKRSQHELLVGLSRCLPVRVLGDPLQSLFKWDGAPPDWESEVEKEFPNIGTLTTPWRWRKDGENRDLGDWVSEMREGFASRCPIDLEDPRIGFVELDDPNRWQKAAAEACFEVAGRNGTAVAIIKWPDDAKLLAQITGGLFQCVEALHAKDAAAALARLEVAAPGDRGRVLVDFVRSISVHGGDRLDAIAALVGGDGPMDAEQDCKLVASLLQRAATGTELADALDAMARLPSVRVFRRELLWAAIDSLRDLGDGPCRDTGTALRTRRNLTSHVGRRLARCSAGTTLLLKGMEFDHAVVVDTGKFSLHDFYVALTRASKSLTVLSASPRLHPGTLPSR